eukprot:g133.t1
MATSWGKSKNQEKFYKGSSKDTLWNKDLLWKKYVEEEARRNGHDLNAGLLLPGNLEESKSGHSTSRSSVDTSRLLLGAANNEERVRLLEKELAKEIAARKRLQRTVEALLSDVGGVFPTVSDSQRENSTTRRVREKLRTLRKSSRDRAAHASRKRREKSNV